MPAIAETSRTYRPNLRNCPFGDRRAGGEFAEALFNMIASALDNGEATQVGKPGEC
ncbi:MAG: hypothetical protein J0H57_13950 [Rhodospirillales bacterium]|nr:hypothetical protein [Rhodospirillales bacterium]